MGSETLKSYTGQLIIALQQHTRAGATDQQLTPKQPSAALRRKLIHIIP
jgi:hypothetical protein